MQLLHSNPYPVAEFASLSLLVDPCPLTGSGRPTSASSRPTKDGKKSAKGSSNDNDDKKAAPPPAGAGPDEAAGPPQPSSTSFPTMPYLATTTMGEAMTVVSPLATSNAPAAHCALAELHGYLHSMLEAEDRAALEAEEMARRRHGKKKKKKKRKKKKKAQAQAAQAQQQQSNGRRSGGGSSPSRPTRGRPDRGDSVHTLETLDTMSEDEDEYETDDDGGTDDEGGEGKLSREEQAQKEQKTAEVLLAMLVAASEERKRREANKDDDDKEETKDDDDDDDDDDDAYDRASEHWFERHIRLRNAVRSDLLRDDAWLHREHPNDVKVYRPRRSGGGMHLHYIVVRDSVLVGRLTGLLLGSSAATTAQGAAGSSGKTTPAAAASALRSSSSGDNNKSASSSRPGDNSRSVSFHSTAESSSSPTGPTGPTISAAVITVGISGCNSTLGTSELVPTLPLRFNDAVALLQGLGIVSAKSVKASKTNKSSSSLANILSEARRYARSTLSALLLADPDGLATNAAINAERGVLDEDDMQFFADGSSAKGSRRGGSKYITPRVGAGSKKFGFSSGKLKRRPGAGSSSKHSLSSSVTSGTARIGLGGAGGGGGAAAGPGEKTRIVFDQYQILGLAEDDMAIPPYQARARLVASGKLQRRKRYGRGVHPLDMGPIDVDAFAPPKKTADSGGSNRRAGPGGARGHGFSPRGVPSARVASNLPPTASNRSPLASPPYPRQGLSRDASAPRLSGPRRDTGPTGGLRRVPSDRRKGGPRRASVEHRTQQAGNEAAASGRDAEVPAMDFFGNDEQPGGQRKEKKKRQPAATFDPFAFDDGGGDGWDVGAGQGQPSSPPPPGPDSRGRGRGIVEATPVPLETPHGVNSEGFFEDAPASPYPQPPPSPSMQRQTSNEAAASALEAAVAATAISAPPIASASEAPTRFQVSVALNEDLTCSYRDSKISSCSVEGMIQVQVKHLDGRGSLDNEEVPPFALYLRDPSRHIRSIQENKKYAGGYGAAIESLTGENVEDNSELDRRFVVTLPKIASYFPVMRYKCSSDLRPVPIRVQTRVRPHGIYCRVALQISSNPANEDDLTDLTIIMAVPPTVRGETLVTSPSGGVWDPDKRSVLWCVAELGEGEKFQLQAQFEMDQGAAGADTRPSFPVLVRSQCMYAQLSDVELEVGDVPELWPAEVSMKLARRFRLSHRERS